MRTYIVTGASSGFGLALSRALAQRADTEVIAAVRDVDRARALGLNARRIDVASQDDVARFVGEWKGAPIEALINNAGMQNSTAPARASADGWDETLATNHLGAYALTTGLLPFASKVMFLGSATQDPEAPTPKRFGFRGAQFAPMAELARVDGPLSGRDRYATSKGLASLAALGLAARFPDKTFFAFDPGLMAGTGLARGQSSVLRFAWNWVLPMVTGFLADGSNPARSAAAAAWLLTEAEPESGATYDHHRVRSRHLHPRATDRAFAEAMLADTDAFLAARRALAA